jgi:hypothetical protein
MTSPFSVLCVSPYSHIYVQVYPPQPLKKLKEFHEIWFQMCSTGGNLNVVLLSQLQRNTQIF